MRPSVRGAERWTVSGLLVASGVLSATALGVAAGAGWRAAGAHELSSAWAAALVTMALVGDVVHGRTGRLRPLSTTRQVPQAWGRIFGAHTVAVLYGARLGIGPLTPLATWLWWAATIISVSAGPAWGAAAGAGFATAQAATVLAASAGVGAGRSMTDRMAAVRSMERWSGVAGAAIAGVGLVALAW